MSIPTAPCPSTRASTKWLPAPWALVVLAALASCNRTPSSPDDAPSTTPAAETTAISTQTAGNPLESSTPTELEVTLSYRDPSKDGWDTEVLSEAAADQLQRLGKFLDGARPTSAPPITELILEEARCGRLRPNELQTVFEGPHFRVARGATPTDSDAFSGAAGFTTALAELAAVFADSHHVHTKFKVIRVSQTGGRFDTDVYVLVDGSTDSGFAQVNATWHCQWDLGAAGQPPRLAAVSVSDYEEVYGSEPGGRLFADCTDAVLGGNASYKAQMLRSTNYWRARLQATLGIDLFGHQGLAVGDANGDGLEDVYVCQPGGLPNRLYCQQPDGTAVDQSAVAGVDLLDRSRSALFVDVDNDGDQDLVVMTDAHVVFLENTGDGTYQIVTDVEVGTCVTLTSADYDNDGDLDLYVCGYSAPRGGESAPVPYHDANNGFQNRLLRNDGQWQFVDVTRQIGLNSNNRRFTLSASWDDFDNDGDVDLYVANDFGRNNLYRNDEGQFVDVAATAGVEDISAGMGVTWGDYNNDGHVDLYVSNMFSSAGNRVAYQRRFRRHDATEVRAEFQRHARGNTLFENACDGTFRDVSVPANVTMGRWAWSSLFADINNDGWQDVLVTNGLVTNEDTKDL